MRRRRGEEEQWLAEAGGELLSSVHISREQ
jgi:hypothetical protein